MLSNVCRFESIQNVYQVTTKKQNRWNVTQTHKQHENINVKTEANKMNKCINTDLLPPRQSLLSMVVKTPVRALLECAVAVSRILMIQTNCEAVTS